MNKKPSRYQQAHHYITNERIRGDRLRVLNEEGKHIGLMPREQALEYAKEKEVDLILVAPGVNPPVVKVIDIHKFLYQEEKKAREGKKGRKKSQTKDLQISLFISDNDKERIKKRALEFLKAGNQVRLRLPLRGREMGKRSMAMQKMTEFIKNLENVQLSSEPRFQGRVVIAIISRQKINYEGQTKNKKISS